MNAKKLVVAALSASMILTATPAFAKETKAEPTKVSAEQQYIISLLEQVVAGDKAAVANAKLAVADAEKAMKADPYLNAALVKVQAKEFILKTEEEKLAKIYTDLSDAMKAIVDDYKKNGATVEDYKAAEKKIDTALGNALAKEANLKAPKTLAKLSYEVTVGEETIAVEVKDVKIDGNVMKVTFGDDAEKFTTGLNNNEHTLAEIRTAINAKTTTNEQKAVLKGLLDKAAAFVTYDDTKAELNKIIETGYTTVDGVKVDGLKTQAANAHQATLDAIKVTTDFPEAVKNQSDKEWDTLHDLDYFKQVRKVEEAKLDLAAEQAAYAKVVAESKVAQKYEAAKAALVAAEEKLAKDEKALADAKAGIKAGDKELVVDGSNGKKQVPNTADAE